MNTQKTHRSIAVTLAAAVALAVGSVWAAEPVEMTKDAKQTIDVFKKADPGLTKLFTESVGYAVLPKVSKGAVGVGAAVGKGVLFEKGISTGKVDMTQITVGASLGGQTYSELIFFQNESALNDFKKGNVTLSAQAGAIAASEGASATARWEKGIQVYTIAKGGLMFEASVGGQRFTYTPFDKEKLGLR